MRSLTALALTAAALPWPLAAQPRTTEPPSNAAYFADCLATSARDRTYQRRGRYLHFTCYGPAAQTFFDALGARPADRAYEETRKDGTWRFTQKPVKDTSGLDYCWRANSPATPLGEYGCTLIFPAGAFLDG